MQPAPPGSLRDQLRVKKATADLKQEETDFVRPMRN